MKKKLKIGRYLTMLFVECLGLVAYFLLHAVYSLLLVCDYVGLGVYTTVRLYLVYIRLFFYEYSFSSCTILAVLPELSTIDRLIEKKLFELVVFKRTLPDKLIVYIIYQLISRTG